MKGSRLNITNTASFKDKLTPNVTGSYENSKYLHCREGDDSETLLQYNWVNAIQSLEYAGLEFASS